MGGKMVCRRWLFHGTVFNVYRQMMHRKFVTFFFMERNLNPQHTSPAGTQSNRQLIFIAEDDPDDIYLFERAMKDLGTGHWLSVFRNGQELYDALKMTGSAEPDIIFL